MTKQFSSQTLAETTHRRHVDLEFFFFFLNNECLLELFTARTVCSQRQAHKPKRLGTTGLKKSLSKKKTLNRFINILCNDENNDQLQLDSSFSFSSSFLSYYIVFIM